MAVILLSNDYNVRGTITIVMIIIAVILLTFINAYDGHDTIFSKNYNSRDT
jgi:hypothetical protein